MTQSNLYILDILEQTSKFFYEHKKFQDAGDILKILSRYTEGETLFKILSNARLCYFMANQVPEAFECLERQMAMVTHSWELYRDKANYLRYLDRCEESEQCLEYIDNDDVRNLAKSWFLHKKGQFKEAFKYVEIGRHGNFWWGARPKLHLPLWNKEVTKNIVIFGESGAGDEIIFSRWINDVKPYCQNLYYYTDNSLSEVFERNFQIQKYSTNITNCVMIPAMSLPYLLEKDEPSNKPYIQARQDLKLNYAKDSRPRIGLCFHGDVNHWETTLRTLPHKELIDALKDLGQLVNLQKDYDEKYDNLDYLPFNSWEDTMALLDTCDIVVTCDTSVAHAAGALGKTVIVLMHAAAYFTWNHNEPVGKSTWYKDAYCVKQTEPCKWQGSVDISRQLIMKILRGNK